MAVLALLVERAGQVVSKDELLAAGWPDSFVSEDSLTHAVSLIRGALRDDAQSPRYLQTVPRRGYRFVAEVRTTGVEPAPLPAEPAPATTGEPPHVPAAPIRQPRLVPGAAAAGMVGIAIIVIAVWVQVSGSATPPPVAELRIARIGLPAFVVEPADDTALRQFVDEVGASFADLLERETRITAVPLPAEADTTAAPAAPVQAVLGAEVRRQGERTSFIAHMGDPVTGDTWWWQEWLLPPGEFAAGDLARSMLTRLWPLLDVASAFSTRPGSARKEATLLLVQSAEMMFDSMQRDFRTSLQAQNVLRRALDMDPSFARARAGLVAVQLEGVGWRPLTSDQEATLRQDAARARQDGPDDPVVLVAQALLHLYDGNLGEAQADLDRAQQQAPELLWIYLVSPDVQLQMGQSQLALASARAGLRLDPYMLAMHGRLIDVLLSIDDLEQAAAAIARLGDLDPGGYWSGRARARLLRRQGDDARAERELQQLRERWPDAPWVHRELADLYRAAGRDDDAGAAEQALVAMVRDGR